MDDKSFEFDVVPAVLDISLRCNLELSLPLIFGDGGDERLGNLEALVVVKSNIAFSIRRVMINR